MFKNMSVISILVLLQAIYYIYRELPKDSIIMSCFVFVLMKLNELQNIVQCNYTKETKELHKTAFVIMCKTSNGEYPVCVCETEDKAKECEKQDDNYFYTTVHVKEDQQLQTSLKN